MLLPFYKSKQKKSNSYDCTSSLHNLCIFGLNLFAVDAERLIIAKVINTTF